MQGETQGGPPVLWYVFGVVFVERFEKQEQRGEGTGREQQVRGPCPDVC